VIVAVDVDGVLRNLVSAIRARFRECFPGRECRDVTAWGLEQFFDVPDDIDFYRWAFEQEVENIYGRAQPYPGAMKALRKLSGNHIIWIVTHQPNARAQRATLLWLAEYVKVPVERIVFDEDKHLLDGYDVLVDDRAEVVVAAQRAGKRAYCVAQPWNEKYDGAPDWRLSFEEIVGRLT
jgi:phosphoglycolate phosphatase-like HAD superfamily hydrolase